MGEIMIQRIYFQFSTSLIRLCSVSPMVMNMGQVDISLQSSDNVVRCRNESVTCFAEAESRCILPVKSVADVAHGARSAWFTMNVTMTLLLSLTRL